VGRVNKSKNIDLLVNFFLILQKSGEVSSLKLIGPQDKAYVDKLISRFRSESGFNHIEFLGPLKRKEFVNSLDCNSTFVHAFDGSLDKTILEATALEVPVLTTNKEYLNDFGSWSGDLSSFDKLTFLAGEYRAYVELSERKLREELTRRRCIVETRHSLNNWSGKVVDHLQEISDG
jgi:glycosyltransferase involved in cell wall biosynthesis